METIKQLTQDDCLFAKIQAINYVHSALMKMQPDALKAVEEFAKTGKPFILKGGGFSKAFESYKEKVFRPTGKCGPDIFGFRSFVRCYWKSSSGSIAIEMDCDYPVRLNEDPATGRPWNTVNYYRDVLVLWDLHNDQPYKEFSRRTFDFQEVKKTLQEIESAEKALRELKHKVYLFN